MVSKSTKPNVRLRLFNAYQDYLKCGNLQANVVRFSELTALDFERLGESEMGDRSGEILLRGSIHVLEERGVPGMEWLRVFVDLPNKHYDDESLPEFIFDKRE